MTLTRQLLSGIVATFIVLLLGIETIYLQSARSNLVRQLDAHANETATSLALSLGSRMQGLDEGLVEAIANPVFDRGHFELLEVQGADGRPIFSRRLEETGSGIPGWFSTAVALDVPTGQALISAGWRQLGKVTVRVHPRFAYQQLWEAGIATLTWLIILFALALLAMRFYLLGILRPLNRIEDAAVAIGNRDFVSIDLQPRTRELQRVIQAINSLSAKIRDAISLETARAERLRREAFEDSATGQLNRRGLENAMAAALAKSAEVHSGALVLFSLSGLEDINRTVGIGKGNEVLKQLSDHLVAPDVPGFTVTGRWQGPTFAAFIANTGQDAVRDWADRLCRNFVQALHTSGLPQTVAVYAGMGCFSGEATVAALSRLAEGALADAAARGAGVSVRIKEAGVEQSDMKSEIVAALEGGRVALVFQKAASIPDGAIIQYEFMSTLTDSRGQAIPAGTFVPVASQHGLLPALDQRVVELAIAALATRADLPQTLSLNIAVQSVMQESFRSALAAMLKANEALAHRLVFEMTGAAAGKSPDLVKAFSKELHLAGSRLAIDNFEMDRNAIALVSEIMPAYVKLAPVFTREIGARDDARFIFEAMLRVFKPLEIPVIAQGVEDQAMVPLLAEMGVSAYQGWALGRPQPLAPPQGP